MADKIFSAGKRIVDLQTTLAMLTTTTSARYLKDYKDPYGRQPFEHPALEGIETLNGGARDYFTHHKQLSALAQNYGFQDVVRWVPKRVGASCYDYYCLKTNLFPSQPDNLNASGYDMVLTQAMYAIVGAIALEQGGATANKVSQERIIRPLQGIGAARKEELQVR